MKRAIIIAVLTIFGLALLVSRHVISGTTMFIIVMLAAAVLVYFVLIWPNLRPKS